jgi:hypothetical protein
MARDQEPVSEEELEARREGVAEQREQVREELAEDLGGEPEGYNADAYRVDGPVTDGRGE